MDPANQTPIPSPNPNPIPAQPIQPNLTASPSVTPQETQPIVPPQPITSPTNNNFTPSPQTPPSEKSNKKIFFILISVLIILAIGAAGWFFFGQKYLSSNKQSDQNPENQATPSESLNNPLLASKYSTDTDTDGIVDFVETGIGTNPLKNECQEKAGCTAELKDTEKKVNNLLLMLDSSGSMAAKSGGQIKMDVAKTSIKSYIDKIASNINVGLMVYGHKGSNEAGGKAASCAGIDTLYPIGSIDKAAFISSIDSFKPTGWTPIAASLQKAKEAFAGKENQNNRILLISDGEETCGGNPSTVAQELKSSGIAVTIDVIGFNVDAKTKAQLQQITQVTGGTYYEASTSEDFMNVFENSSKNISSLFGQGSCLSQNYMEYNSCLADMYMKALSYINNLAATITDPTEVSSLANLSQTLSNKYQELSNKSGSDFSQQLNENTQKMQEQFNNKLPTP